MHIGNQHILNTYSANVIKGLTKKGTFVQNLRNSQTHGELVYMFHDEVYRVIPQHPYFWKTFKANVQQNILE